MKNLLEKIAGIITILLFVFGISLLIVVSVLIIVPAYMYFTSLDLLRKLLKPNCI